MPSRATESLVAVEILAVGGGREEEPKEEISKFSSIANASDETPPGL
jgi:hypothetical protein